MKKVNVNSLHALSLDTSKCLGSIMSHFVYEMSVLVWPVVSSTVLLLVNAGVALPSLVALAVVLPVLVSWSR